MTHLLLALLLAAPTTAPADAVTAQQIMAAHGSDAWSDIEQLDFTFVVTRPDGSEMRRSHAWNVPQGECTVTTPEGEMTVNVVDFDSANATDAEKAAFAAWTNDSYWLLMPLKLGDPGVTATTLGEQEAPGDLGTLDAVELSFDNVGLTPGDSYVVYADDEGVVRGWTFTSARGNTFTVAASEVEAMGGLNLVTKYDPVGGQGPSVRFEDVKVTARD